MRGIHTSRRDRTTQVISCNPWSTRLCPYPSLIRKMKTYLELEGKLDPKPKSQPQLQPCTSTPSHNRKSSTRKALVPKKVDKIRRARALVKRRYQVRVFTQPMPTTPTLPMNPIPPAIPTPIVATSTATSQMSVVKSAAPFIPVTVYNLAQGKFKGITYPQEGPKWKKILLPQAAICPNQGNNLELYPISQPSRSDRTAHGLTP